MLYKSALLMLAIVAGSLQSCVTTKATEKAAWLSNDKMFATAPTINGLTMVAISTAADKDLYVNTTLKLQDKLKTWGIDCNMQYFTDADNRESARAKLTGSAKDFLLYLQPMKGVTALDELNNQMIQKQMEFVVETKAGEKIAAGLISVDKETLGNKLANEMAGIIANYLHKQRMAR